MATLASIRQAFRAGITANADQKKYLRRLRRSLREAQDVIEDLDDALDYLQQTDVSGIESDDWRSSISLIIQGVDTMPVSGARSLQRVRNKFRGILVDVDAPQWLKTEAEVRKRTTKVKINQQGTRVYDQQPSDPIEALADAALVVISAADSTRQEINDAAEVLRQWTELSPDD